MTQTDKLVAYLRNHPASTSLELTLALGIVNVTGRVSDARAEGHIIECKHRADKRQGYTLIESDGTLGLMAS